MSFDPNNRNLWVHLRLKIPFKDNVKNDRLQCIKTITSVTNSRLTCLCGHSNSSYTVLFQMLVVSSVCSLHQVKKSRLCFGSALKNMLKTMAFQSGDNQDLLTRKRDQNKDSRLDGVSSDLMPDSRLEMPGMLDCCSIGDHVPLIGYWWAEPRGQCPR